MKGNLDVDFVMAIILFVSVYGLLYTLLPSATISFRNMADPLNPASQYFADVLVATPGIPPTWNSLANVNKLGLAYGNNVSSYANIIDATKVAAINNQLCSSLESKTDITLDFAIQIETSRASLGCNATIPKTARLIERIGYLKNGTNYDPAKIKIWTW